MQHIYSHAQNLGNECADHAAALGTYGLISNHNIRTRWTRSPFDSNSLFTRCDNLDDTLHILRNIRTAHAPDAHSLLPAPQRDLHWHHCHQSGCAAWHHCRNYIIFYVVFFCVHPSQLGSTSLSVDPKFGKAFKVDCTPPASFLLLLTLFRLWCFLWTDTLVTRHILTRTVIAQLARNAQSHSSRDTRGSRQGLCAP